MVLVHSAAPILISIGKPKLGLFTTYGGVVYNCNGVQMLALHLPHTSNDVSNYRN